MIPRRDELSLPVDPSTPSVARTKLASFLTRHHVPPDVIDDALIVLSEMIANAVSHGVPIHNTGVVVRWELDPGSLHLTVADGGSGAKAELQALDFDEDSLSGRGLGIINKVADRWWVEEDPGTSVHAELRFG